MQTLNANAVTKATLLTFGLSTLGSVAGIVVAVKRKSGFWGGFGWFILGGFAGVAIGEIIGSTMDFTKNETTITN